MYCQYSGYSNTVALLLHLFKCVSQICVEFVTLGVSAFRLRFAGSHAARFNDLGFIHNLLPPVIQVS